MGNGLHSPFLILFFASVICLRRVCRGARASDVFVVGDVCQKLVSSVVVVYPATKMLYAIADDKVGDLQFHIVATYLVEHSLGNGNRWGLVLDNDYRFGVGAIDNTVASLLHLANLQRCLVGNSTLGIVFVGDKEVHKMLADPFLWRQCYVALPEYVEYLRTTVLLLCLQVCIGKIECWHHCGHGRCFSA